MVIEGSRFDATYHDAEVIDEHRIPLINMKRCDWGRPAHAFAFSLAVRLLKGFDFTAAQPEDYRPRGLVMKSETAG